MLKTKYIVGGAIIATLAVGGGVAVLRNKNNNQTNNTTSSVQGTYTEQQLSQTSDSSSIPLSPTKPSTKPSGGLSVAPNSPASNLGQLTPNSNGANTPSSSSSPKTNMLDPTTFAQYDKYKDGEGALFGEVQVGTGDELTAGKKAAVYYKGWLTDGKLFDMSRTDQEGKLQPFVFEMGGHQVIAGWEQGLMGMKVGGTRLLIVPPSVGYGAAGQDPIPGNAVLVFQVQLLAVE